MAAKLSQVEIQDFLQQLGDRYQQPGQVYLLGGSALCLLGSPRQTLDIDYVVSGATGSLQAEIETLADEMRLELEAVPIEEFIPLPDGADTCHHFIGQFGQLEVLSQLGQTSNAAELIDSTKPGKGQ